MHEVLVNRLGGLSLPRKNVVRLTDRPDMTLDVYRGRKTAMQQQQQFSQIVFPAVPPFGYSELLPLLRVFIRPIRRSVDTDNFIGCDESCLHSMKQRSGKFDLK